MTEVSSLPAGSLLSLFSLSITILCLCDVTNVYRVPGTDNLSQGTLPPAPAPAPATLHPGGCRPESCSALRRGEKALQ